MNDLGGVMTNDITLQEVCRILGKSKRTVSRYIKAGKLRPEKVKSQKGMILINLLS